MAQQGWTPVSEDTSAWTPVSEGPIPASEQAPLPEGPTSLGFAGNVLTSGMQFGQNIGQALIHPADTVKALYAAISHPSASGKAMKKALIERYGSIDAALQSAYSDPVGVASDLSLLAGGAGMAAKGVGLTKTAGALSAASEVLNPLSIPAKAAQVGGKALYTAAVNPSRRINRAFPGAMDAGYDLNALPTEGGLQRAEAALEDSAGATRRLLQQAESQGAPPVNVKAQVIGNLKEPAKQAGVRYRLGGADERLDISQRAKELAARNPVGVPLTAANDLKQQAQRLADTAFRAQERGAVIKDLDALSNVKVAQALRAAIETNAANVGVSSVRASNAQTQALIGLTQALEEATHQPTRLTNLIGAATAGGGAMAGGGPGAAAAYGTYRVATSKPVMAATGLASGKVGTKVLRQAQIARALAFLQSLQGQEAP